jgi:hypothetical protein
MRNNFNAIALAATMLSAASNANATALTWTASNIYFDRDGFASTIFNGTFDYDATTGTFANANFSLGLTNGSCCWSGTVNAGSSTAQFLTLDTTFFSQTALVNLAGPMTNAGGTIGLTSGTYGSSTLRSGQSISAPVPSVPEPASWALMIAGFGIAGGALRRRAARAVRFA